MSLPAYRRYGPDCISAIPTGKRRLANHQMDTYNGSISRGPAAMQTVRLGRTNARVSVAGLGCGGPSRLGMARGADVHHAAGVVRRALDLGVSFIDTARSYGTEEAVGAGIAGRRDQVFLSTKS